MNPQRLGEVLKGILGSGIGIGLQVIVGEIRMHDLINIWSTGHRQIIRRQQDHTRIARHTLLVANSKHPGLENEILASPILVGPKRTTSSRCDPQNPAF